MHLRRLAIAASTIAILGLGVFVPAAGAGAPVGVAPLDIVKTVSGPVPDGTTFTVALDCNKEAIVQGGTATDGVTATFGADGQPTSASTFRFNQTNVSCNVTETVDGGAASTTYACESTLPTVTEGATAEQVADICEADGPQADPIGVNIVTSSQTATVTVHNTFDEAPTTTTTTTKPQAPAASPAAVVAQPTFTG